MMAMQNVDQRVLGAGTTVRFGLLLALLVAASASAISAFLSTVVDPHNNSSGCALAAGLNPGSGLNSGYLSQLLSIPAAEKPAVTACLERYVPGVPWWGPILGLGLLIGVAGAFFWGIPAWKGRRSQVVEVHEVDVRGDLAPALEALAQEAGLERVTFVLNSGRVSTSAVAFGRPGRYTVCLDGGLVARRRADPSGFRAVVLHELAHIRNGDVTIAYATVALWRAFLTVILVPQAVLRVRQLIMDAHSAEVGAAWELLLAVRSLLLLAFLTVLVYLTRADILRSREIYADLDAVALGADPSHWPDTAATAPHPFRSFLELWRTHPRWDQRKLSLTDPVLLFGLQPLPTFLTGAAAVILGDQVPSLLSTLFPGGGWLNGLAPWLTALPITVIIGVALWRAVAHAVLTGRRPPSGLRTGLWLGAGLVVGEFLLAPTNGSQWIPTRPEVLVLPLVAAVVITWWTGQCAELFVRAWRGGTLRPAMFLGLAVSWLVFTFWFGWWQNEGRWYVTGAAYNYRLALEHIFRAPSTSHAGAIAVVAPVTAVLDALGVDPLTIWATAAMWLVPLLVWTVRPPVETPRWVRRAMPDAADPPLPPEQLPSLRKPLRVALLGGALGAIAVVAVMAYQHTWQPPTDNQRAGLYLLVYVNLLTLAVAVAPLAAAIGAALIIPRYRLLVALAAAGIAALISFTAALVLFTTDGCLGPLNTMMSTCHPRPVSYWGTLASVLAQDVGPAVLGPGMFLAATAVLFIEAIRRLAQRGIPARSTEPIPSRRARWVTKRAGIAVIGVAALGLTAAGTVPSVKAGSVSPVSSASIGVQLEPAHTDTPAPAEVRRAQMHAWFDYGGMDLLNRFLGADMQKLGTALKGKTFDPPTVAAICTDINQAMRSANAYFPVPDPELQAEWSTVINNMTQGSTECENSIQRRDKPLFVRGITTIGNVAGSAEQLFERMVSEAKS